MNDKDDKTMNFNEEGHQFTKPENPGKRFGAYALEHQNIQILVAVNEAEFTPEEHDKLGAMACRGAMAAIGEMRHGDKTQEILARIKFYFTDPAGNPVRAVAKKWLDKVYEAIILGVNMLVSVEQYDGEFLPQEGGEDDGLGFGSEDVMAEYRKFTPIDKSKLH